jgi:hypothetical protein
MIIMVKSIAGMMGTVLFGTVLLGTVLLALSALEYDFMLGIGWRPVADPAEA